MKERSAVGPPFHVMTKPRGPLCNLDCKYCFYLEKEGLYPTESRFRMSETTLEIFIRQVIESQEAPEITFTWQGGEPTLMGLDFYRRVVELQRRYCPPGRRITNALQTNGTLLDHEWCVFLHENAFLVGISLDGPRELHDRYRLDKRGQSTFDKVMKAIALLKHHRVEFNTLTVVHRETAKHPLEVYRFLKEHGSGYIQFIPVVERPGELLTLAPPPHLHTKEPPLPVTPWSVDPHDYGEFLCTIYDEWIQHDVGRIYVQLFDVALGIWLGMPSAMCVFSETCGNALALEHNGDLYSCDHYVYPEYRLGNIHETPLRVLVDSEPQRRFGQEKQETLPRYCRECHVRFACNGECPKHRFLITPDGEPGWNYLCAAYRRFFRHIDPTMKKMAALIRAGYPASNIMTLTKIQKRTPGRNDPCPCGSGQKFKRCCGSQIEHNRSLSLNRQVW